MKRILLAAVTLLAASTATAAPRQSAAQNSQGVEVFVGFFFTANDYTDTYVEYTAPDGSAATLYPDGTISNYIQVANGSTIRVHVQLYSDERMYYSITGLGMDYRNWFDAGNPFTYENSAGYITPQSPGVSEYYDGPGIAIMADPNGYYPGSGM